MTPLICPRTNSLSFSTVPELKLNGLLHPPADVHLLVGRHAGPHRGFGQVHIWAEHAKEMERLGLHTIDDVPSFVERVVQPGTPLHHEGGSWRKERLLAVRSPFGTAVLEWRCQRDGPIWSVVTVFLRRNPVGVRIGRLY
jgi:hypothetical protein